MRPQGPEEGERKERQGSCHGNEKGGGGSAWAPARLGSTLTVVKTLSFVFTSHATSMDCRRIERGADADCTQHMRHVRPGLAMLVNSPHHSTMRTVPWSVVKQ